MCLRICTNFKGFPSERRIYESTLVGQSCSHKVSQKVKRIRRFSEKLTFLPGHRPRVPVGDKFGESLGGSRAPPSFWEVPRLPRKFPQLPRKFFGDFPGGSLTVELSSNPGVPRKFPGLPRKFPKLPRKFPKLPRRSAPFSGKPDTLS